MKQTFYNFETFQTTYKKYTAYITVGVLVIANSYSYNSKNSKSNLAKWLQKLFGQGLNITKCGTHWKYQRLTEHSILVIRPTVGVSWFLPARRYASAGYRDRNVSVRLSVTRRYCVKTKKASVMISSPSGSPKTLVFWRQISSPNSKGFKQGSVGKIHRFLAVSDNNPSTNQQFTIFNREYLENGSRYGQSYY